MTSFGIQLDHSIFYLHPLPGEGLQNLRGRGELCVYDNTFDPLINSEAEVHWHFDLLTCILGVQKLTFLNVKNSKLLDRGGFLKVFRTLVNILNAKCIQNVFWLPW